MKYINYSGLFIQWLDANGILEEYYKKVAEGGVWNGIWDVIIHHLDPSFWISGAFPMDNIESYWFGYDQSWKDICTYLFPRIEKEVMFAFDDFRSGMTVELRNGEKYKVLVNTKSNKKASVYSLESLREIKYDIVFVDSLGSVFISDYFFNLTHIKDKNFDVVKIFDFDVDNPYDLNGEVLWERGESEIEDLRMADFKDLPLPPNNYDDDKVVKLPRTLRGKYEEIVLRVSNEG